MVLDWFSGGSSTPGGEGDRNLFMRMYNGEVQAEYTTNFDPPETPAHLFPLRAFKQAIFGTPQPSQRTSGDSKGLRSTDSVHEIKPVEGVFPYNTVDHVYRQERGNEFGLSPSKRPGILLTPGTGGQRRKTVSFGDDARGSRTATVSACAGKHVEPPLNMQQSLRHSQNAHNTAGLFSGSYDDITIDMAAPRSASGQYWKREYDSACEKSALELRKLAKKEQIAKRFAKQKDIEVQGLVEELQRESNKVAHLETQLADYVAQLASAATSINKRCTKQSQTSRVSQQALRDVKPQSDYLQRPNSVVAGQKAKLEEQQEDQNSQRDTRKSSLKEESIAKATDSGVAPQLHASQQPQSTVKIPAYVTKNFAGEVRANSGFVTKGPIGDSRDHRIMVSCASKSRYQQHSRSPLQPRTANFDILETEVKKTEDSTLSTERREAAKRRLQEKRRARATATLTSR